jgi:UDP-galactopyranose mutase
MLNKYDFLIVGSGLFGSVCAYELNKKGYKVLVIEKRNHIGGNVYTEQFNDIHIHKYGAHIFHTNKKEVWDYVNNFGLFQPFQNEPIANYNGELYNLPFNMHTFYQLYGIKTIDELECKMEEWNKYVEVPKNLKELAIKTIGNIAYEKLVKHYTEKQWGESCDNLSPDILGRIPVRKEWNNNYFNDKYQGIPENGYTNIISNMLKGIKVILNEEFDINKHYNIANKIIFCGSIDSLFNYELGVLEYRSLKFKEHYNKKSIGIPVMNFTSNNEEYTRIIDHKMFLLTTKNSDNTVLTYEYPIKWTTENERYYPIPSDKNLKLYTDYNKLLQEKYPNIIPGGRLGLYKYFNMDNIIESALSLTNKINIKNYE